MPIPLELAQYGDEDAFVKRFLLPLFRRMGFEIVANYHGRREFGKDLLLGEVDRFSHVRFHGVQAKYEPSIGKEAMHGLVQQCDEAFIKPFTHPQTGQIQRISSFYAVTAGTVSDEARELFFESLQPKHADNVRIIEGKDLLALDRFSVISRSEAVRELLDGLLHECRFGLNVLEHIVPELKRIADSDGHNVVYPLLRLRVNAVAAFLIKPVAFVDVPIKTAEELWSRATAFNQTLDQAGASPLHTVVSIKNPAIAALQLTDCLKQEMEAIISGVERSMAQLGAIAAL